LPIAFTYAARPITLPSLRARAAQFLFHFASYFPASTEKHPVTTKTAFLQNFFRIMINLK